MPVLYLIVDASSARRCGYSQPAFRPVFSSLAPFDGSSLFSRLKTYLVGQDDIVKIYDVTDEAIMEL